MGSGPTDPAEEHFDKGLWGWASTAWVKLTSLSNLLGVALHGYDGTAWRKLPILWGYSDVYGEAVYTPDVDGGDEVIALSVVPAGEVWVITQLLAYSAQTNATRMEFVTQVGGVEINVKRAAYPTAYMSLDWQGFAVLKAGDQVRFVMRSAAAGDDFWTQAVGYKMKVTL